VKTYLVTTGVLFGLITVAHIWRMFSERPQLAEEFWYVLLTGLSAALCIWAFMLLKKSKRS
jgi:dolichyl-phosphate-mannose--protein O-mannosyl transferase